jgi:1,2-diacylglycerol 3-alpha-glucosyltransferase
MNIGIVTTWFERGAAYVSRAYMEALSKQHNVFIYVRAGERYAEGDLNWDKPYVTWGKKISRMPLTHVDWEDFKGWVFKNNLHAVIFNEQRSWEVIVKALTLDIMLGMYVDYYTPELIPFFRLFDFLLCNTKRHYSVFKDHPQAIYIPWGTDINLFKPNIRAGSESCTRFFHSCGMDPQRKGTDIMVKAFQKVKGNARLIIHSQGKLAEYPLRWNLSEDTYSFIEGDTRIEVIEKEMGAPGLYHLGDVYVYPSKLEGIGLTIAEALASGLPVITTDAPPMNEFVINAFNGRLVKVELYEKREDSYYWPLSFCSETALQEAMQFFVDSRHLLDSYKKNAREYAETHLDWKKNSATLPDFIKNLSRVRTQSNQKLIKSVMQYEKTLYPHSIFLDSIKSLLVKTGAGKIKRLLKRIGLRL